MHTSTPWTADDARPTEKERVDPRIAVLESILRKAVAWADKMPADTPQQWQEWAFDARRALTRHDEAEAVTPKVDRTTVWRRQGYRP